MTNNIVIKANNVGLMDIISAHLMSLFTKSYICKWLTIDFNEHTFTMNGIDTPYDTALGMLRGIENMIWVKKHESGYFTSLQQALRDYLEQQELIRLAEDEASFTHAAKEIGYDKDLYPDGQDFEEAKPGLGEETFTITMDKSMLTFPKSWMRTREEEE